MLAQRAPDICVCGGIKQEHDGCSQPRIFTHPPSIQGPLSMSSLAPVPGSSHPVVDSAPITHIFSPDRQLHGTPNERRNTSATRATARNRGGIPSPVSHPPRRATQSSNASRPRPKPPSKLTILLLPFHVSCNAGSGILSYYSYADERIADSTQVGHTCKLLTKVLDRVGCCI